MMRGVFGVIFPISSDNASSLFDQKRNIFVKFTNRTKLEQGSKIIFYLSGEKKLIGEGKIAKIEKMNPKLAWNRYEKQIFLNKDGYNQYVMISPITKKDRKMTEITVFILKNLRKYKNPIKCIYIINPSGRYLTKEEYQRCMHAI